MARPVKRRSQTASRRSGCLIWLIPLTLGLIVLAANPPVLKELGRLLSGTAGQSTASSTNARSGQTNRTLSASESAAPPTLRRLPDTSELEAIISRDMREQEKRITEGLEKKSPSREKEGQTHQVQLHFARYDAPHDQLVLTPVNRTVRQSETPALTALVSLLEGPSAEELKAGYRSLIPRGVRIRRMHVEKGILILDVSREFIHNQTLGQEGLILQIYQVVNTMTDFPTVDGVRFLVEGRILPAAGGDGVPLDRIFRHNPRPLGNR